MRVVYVIGTRPDIIKMSPVIKRGPKGIVLHTGQHYSPALDKVFLDDFGVVVDHRLPHHDGDSGATFPFTVEAVKCFLVPTDVVVVYGDTLSAFAAALAAKQRGCYLIHVEAGLRSGDLTMPEEVARIAIDSIADLMCVQSADVADRLQKERPTALTVYTGNTIQTVLSDMGLTASPEPRKIIVATLHRRENAPVFGRSMDILGLLSQKLGCEVIMPVHPASRSLFLNSGKLNRNILVTDPMRYQDFMKLVASSTAVVTDSGGLQEETAILGVPCITLRKSTERWETVGSGWNALVDPHSERSTKELVDAVLFWMAVPAMKKLSYGGNPAERVATQIAMACDRIKLQS